MKRIKDEVVEFFKDQGFVVVSTIDKNGSINNACKGILKISNNGKVYLLDLYQGKTLSNLMHNSHVSLTAVDEHKFTGYCLKGRAQLIKEEALITRLFKMWEEKLTSRITKRIIKNIQGEKGHSKHPEVLLPQPEYMIVVEVNEVIDLTPHHLQEGSQA